MTPVGENRAARTAAAVADHVAAIRAQQRPIAAWGAAAVAAVAGAGLYGGVAATTNMQYGAAALAVGALTGLAVRLIGRGASARYGFLAVVWALVGVGAGYALGHALLARQAGAPGPWGALWLAGARAAYDNGTPMDYCFYAIAAAEAWWLGYRRLPRHRRPSRGEEAP